MAEKKTSKGAPAPSGLSLRSQALSGLADRLNKAHGGGTMGLGAALRPQVTPRYSSGSLALDFALGGGFPVGRVALVYGGESSGKTTTVLRALGEAQRCCRNCQRTVTDWRVEQVQEEVVDVETGEVLTPARWEARGTCDCVAQRLYVPKRVKDETDAAYAARVEELRPNSFAETVVAFIDAEGTFDWAWARQVGLDPRVLLYVCPATLEETTDLYDEIVRSADVDAIALDSLAALTPAVEIEESAENDQRAAAAKIINKLVRKVTAASNDVVRLHGRMVTHFWINQTRKTMKTHGNSWGEDETIPGGGGQRFISSVTMKLWSSAWEDDETLCDVKKADQIKIGVRVRQNFIVKKNKTAASHASGGYALIVAGPDAGRVDEENFMVDMATQLGYIVHEKKWQLYLPLKAEPQVFATKTALMAYVQEPARWAMLRRQLLRRMLDQVAGNAA